MEGYKGIRYAKAERLGKPVMEPDVVKVEDLEQKIVVCPQLPTRIEKLSGPTLTGQEMGEDCLRLSIFTPDREGCRPVLLFVHGGAFIAGSGLLPIYDGTHLAERIDAVVVTVSYRLGALGFLCIPEKGVVNLGVEDIACAMRWVKRNIAKFGGDADNITVAGHSSGAYCVAQIIEREEENLFRRAHLMSCPLTAQTTEAQAVEVTQKYLSLLGCDMETASMEEILRAQGELMKQVEPRTPFSSVGGNLAKSKHVMPGLEMMLLSTCKQDAMPFVPRYSRLMVWLMTKLIFMRPMKVYGHAMTKNHGVKVLHITYDRLADEARYGVTHCMEMPLLFGTYDSAKDIPILEGVSKESFEFAQRGALNIEKNFVDGKL